MEYSLEIVKETGMWYLKILCLLLRKNASLKPSFKSGCKYSHIQYPLLWNQKQFNFSPVKFANITRIIVLFNKSFCVVISQVIHQKTNSGITYFIALRNQIFRKVCAFHLLIVFTSAPLFSIFYQAIWYICNHFWRHFFAYSGCWIILRLLYEVTDKFFIWCNIAFNQLSFLFIVLIDIFSHGSPMKTIMTGNCSNRLTFSKSFEKDILFIFHSDHPPVLLILL